MLLDARKFSFIFTLSLNGSTEYFTRKTFCNNNYNSCNIVRCNRTPATLHLPRHLPITFVSAGWPVDDPRLFWTRSNEHATGLTGPWKEMRVSFLGSNLATPVSVRDTAKLFLWDVLESRVFKNDNFLLPATCGEIWLNICCSSSYHAGCNIHEQVAVSCPDIIIFRGVRLQLQKCCYISRTHEISFSWCVNNSGIVPSQSFCTVRFLK
jgi:hypothetical protein